MDKAIPVKAVLLLYLAYLIKFDKNRILKIFIRIMDSNDETLIKSGIHSLQYLVNHDFDKLKPFISEEKINKFVMDCIMRPITSTYINNREELSRHIKMLNNVVGSIRIMRRLGDKTKLIFPDIKFERMKI